MKKQLLISAFLPVICLAQTEQTVLKIDPQTAAIKPAAPQKPWYYNLPKYTSSAAFFYALGKSSDAAIYSSDNILMNAEEWIKFVNKNVKGARNIMAASVALGLYNWRVHKARVKQYKLDTK